MVRPLALVTLLAALAHGASGCVNHDDTTQLTVAISSEALVPSELSSFEVQVFGPDGSLKLLQTYYPEDVTYFPVTLDIIPENSSSLNAPVTITVSGFAAGSNSADAGSSTPFLLRRAVVSYVVGRSLYVPMPLRMACVDVTDCNASDSCVGGTCQTATLDGNALADYSPDLVFGDQPGAACFSEATCLADHTTLSVAPDCTFAIPAGVPLGSDGRPSVNVSIEWSKASTSRIIALDEGDAVEGWTLTSPTQGKLSPGICLAVNEEPDGGPVPDHATAAMISTGCAPKGKLQPYCPRTDGDGPGVGVALSP
jgi:hypothetical protein